MSILNPEITLFLTDITKQPLINFESKKPWKYKQLRELRRDHSCS